MQPYIPYLSATIFFGIYVVIAEGIALFYQQRLKNEARERLFESEKRPN